MTDRLPPLPRPTLRQRLFARALAHIADGGDDHYDGQRRRLIGGLTGDVLEIGPGTGPNLRYFSADVRWQAVEPNPALFPYLQREAARLGRDCVVRFGHAERIDSPDEHFDAVVSTLVLCSVVDPQQVLAEIRRVLKPGGRFIFIEHVAAPAHTRQRWLQGVVKPLWKPLSEGCHPDRETEAVIRSAGFQQVTSESFAIPTPIVSPHIAGYAIK